MSKRYRVYLSTTVSTTVEVTADTKEDAIEEALTKGVPGLMFVNHDYPDVGDWDALEDDVEEIQ